MHYVTLFECVKQVVYSVVIFIFLCLYIADTA